MNQFKSGTLFVIAATVIAAVLMLMTGRDTSSTSNVQKEEVAETIETAEVEAKVETEAVVSTEAKNGNTESVVETDKVEEIVSKNDEKNTLVSHEPVEIKAPEGPYNKSSSESKVKESTQSTSENLESSPVSENEEKTDQAIKAESINTVATSTQTQHDLVDHLTQPIWMDQKLGDFKSVEKGEVIFKIMPTSPDGLQGEDPKQVVTDKNDKFAPTTVSADYNYQQMPMYNGGYYIAPMPPYLMESMLPISEPVKNQ